MSAFQVSPAHIIKVATYGASSIPQAVGIAHMLAAANAESVAYRYREDVLPHDIDYMAVRKAYHAERSALEVVKLCDCLAYQCCEIPGWDMGYAKAMLDLIRQKALGDAGYPGWSGEAYRGLGGYMSADWSI